MQLLVHGNSTFSFQDNNPIFFVVNFSTNSYLMALRLNCFPCEMIFLKQNLLSLKKASKLFPHSEPNHIE